MPCGKSRRHQAGGIESLLPARRPTATHPDYKLPGIEASTGSLGHGMGLAIGMALAR